MTKRCSGLALALAVLSCAPLGAADSRRAPTEPSFIMIDAGSGQVRASRWEATETPVPLGSVIKPFTALAYGDAHHYDYPTVTCRGTADGCWLAAGHGAVGLVDAVAVSCNHYFKALAAQLPLQTFRATLRRFGIVPPSGTLTPDDMTGVGERLPLSPVQILRAYVELSARRSQPGVASVIQGMLASARRGTGRAVGESLHGVDALVKTGTAPCIHQPNADGDGYAVVVYPADRPRVALLMQSHGHTGSEAAMAASVVLREQLGLR